VRLRACHTREIVARKINLLQLVAVSLELFTEGLELATARRVCVALPAWQFRLGSEFWLRIGRRGADKSESRTRAQRDRDADRQAKARRTNWIGRATNF
jgi:hypothetical protein